ncbi:MAG: N,N'-diacetylchitobiose phosphorylase [candidate division KSB1 bacterium]|nr:N,N'-diacetylchitobiose phosphorylase [candidate division KSB1 bacterium]
MQFGYFDDQNKEYVITNPKTPKSWSNYLGSREYGAIITNNAGGFSFYKSGGMGRFLRFRFNSIPMDQPGRYIYLRDDENGDYWSASWQPVGKPLDRFKSECRHGTGYTIIRSEYDGIRSKTAYFVPLGKNYEIWKVKISNLGSRTRKLSTFTYVEYAGNWNAIDDLLNIQYVQFTTIMQVIDGIIDHGTNIYIPEMPDNFNEKDQGRHTFMALVGAEVVGYDTDRETFLGQYRTYANPETVEQGCSKNSLGYGDNPCGSLHSRFELKPGETKEFLVIVGVGKADEAGRNAVRAYRDLSQAERELEAVKAHWHEKLAAFMVYTPDPQLNSTINVWGAYNNLITFTWSRAVSLIYSGIDRDGLGYRDTVQDLVGVAQLIPEQVRETLELMITGQVSTGGAMPVVLPTSHQPGKEKAPPEHAYRSDDCLWLFNAVPTYVKETGDIDFYKKVLPYADRGEDTVFCHLKRAIEFSVTRSGKHGLPCGLAADWNDCLRFGRDGESIFVALQLRLALTVYIEVAQLLDEQSEKRWAENLLATLDENIQKHAWDGEWFLRGYRADGLKFGSRENDEGQIYLNPQSWAIISGAATPKQAELAMNQVNERLVTEYGIRLCDPPYTHSDFHVVRAQLMNPGLKENGGIFIHTQGWAIMAETILGHGDRAYQYLRAYLPAAYNDKAEIREIEPYVLSQLTHAQFSPKYGASRIPWLSGSASWTYHAICQYILGIRPEYDGLRIDPCIPSHWQAFEVQRMFRGKKLEIKVDNHAGVQKGVKELWLNGERIAGNFLPAEKLQANNNVEVKLGKP